MKRIFWLFIILIPIHLFGQTFDEQFINQKWKELDVLVEKQNYEQTLPYLAVIKSYAKKENKPAHWVRAILAENKVKTINKTNEDSFIAIRQHFIESIKQSNDIEAAILNNYYAMFLWSNAKVFKTKSKDDFIIAPGKRKQQIIDSLFKISLKPKDLLLKQKSENWATLFSEVKNISLTPTLFHFLSYQYLDFLKHTDNKKEYNELSKIILSINKEHNYADATAYRLSTENNLEYSVDWEKKMIQIIDENPSDYNAYILYLLANRYLHQDMSKAMKYITQAKNNYPKSPWLENNLRLEKKIKRAELSIEHQQFEPSDNYIPLKIHARNTDSLYIRVYRTTSTPKAYNDFSVKYDSLTFLTSLAAPVVYEEAIALKKFEDFKNHKTIYKLNPLSYGTYTILVSNNRDLKNDGEEKTVAKSTLTVSDVFITASLDKETDDYELYKALLIDRKTGKPYANKQVELYQVEKNKAKLIAKSKTDINGEFVYKSKTSIKFTDLDDLEIYIPKENQLIDLMDLNEVPEHLDEDQEHDGYISFETMTDRAIYRPGQTVYFKSILYNNHNTKGKVISDKKIEISLLDVNRQKIDSITLTTNEFGSINGSFKLPSQTLAGSFQLQLTTKDRYNDTHAFRVEEYKRPTFKVEFETNKETYTHKDTAIFVGKVESLSGAKLSDASVRYKINYYSSRNYKNNLYVDSLIQTDSEGKFYIKVPLSDTTFSKLNSFNLYYSVEVTNPAGEMQQASSSYNFNTKPWAMNIISPRSVEEGKWSSIKMSTTNQNGQPLKFEGKINIYKKDMVTKPISRKNLYYFKQAEYHLLSEQEYEKYFPHYFDKQTIKEEAKHLIASYHFNTNVTSLVKIDSNLFKRGYYEIEAISIQGLDTIKSNSNTAVYDAKTRKIAKNDFLSYVFDKSQYSAGDKVTLTFYTDVENPQNLFLFESRGTQKQNTKVLDWKNGKATYSFVLTDKMISPAMEFTALFIKNNQAQSFTNIRVPILEKNKLIEIKTSTFRDKITPGQKEKWTFNLHNKESKLQAELLATMYDNALDAFAGNHFRSTFNLYYDYSNLNFYYLQHEFDQQQSSYSVFNKFLENPRYDNMLSSPRTYDLWYSIGSIYNLRKQFDDDSNTVEEVVVTAYSNKKTTVTGSVAMVQRKVSGVAVGDQVFESVGEINEVIVRGISVSSQNSTSPLYVVDGKIVDAETFNTLKKDQIADINVLKDAAATALYGARGANGVILITTKEAAEKNEALANVKARTNLQETAFFYPTLYNDAEGNVSFEFESPEALTKWKLLLFAHSKTLQSGSATYFTQTQKQLMVRPNLPRYFREDDKITIKAQVQNLTKEPQKGDAQIAFIDPETNEDITEKFKVEKKTQSFDALASKNTIVQWNIIVPKEYPTVHIKIVAANASFSDGEQQELAILPNRILISDTEKIVLKPNQSQEYKIESAQKDNLQARIQVQSNPILEIISALDYLKNYPYECNEQTVSKWFGLKMVEYISNNYPTIATYFKTLSTDEVSSKLEENAALSELKLEEMPWLRDIKHEESKLKSIAKLFSANVHKEINTLEQKIAKNQLQNGGFAWFDGGIESTYISTRILEVLGKALKLNQKLINTNMRNVAEKLSTYLDNDTTMVGPKSSTYQALDYLYARHYWQVYFPVNKEKLEKVQTALNKSSLTTAKQAAGIAAKSWISSQLFGHGKNSNEIKNRIVQEAIIDEEKGMYWESNSNSYNNTSLQAYMVEAYQFHDPRKLHDITQWLYYNKQANHWQTTWMTVDAIYALLLANNPQDFAMENTVSVWIDNKTTEQNKIVLGQFTKALDKKELSENKAIKIQNNNDRSIYGNIVHQYFTPLEEVKKSVQDISIEKKFLVERNGQWQETSEAKLGERIKIHITVINDNRLEYVHLKDARPSGVEPIFEPSGYKWRQGYYYTIKDASTNYFFDTLAKGKREFEYEVKANNVGIFNSGVTTIECMYELSVQARSANSILKIVE